MHVIPVEKAISLENQSIDIEHISYWLKKYEGHIGASICSCRYGRKKLDEGCADDYHDWCIAVGDMADYVVEQVKSAVLDVPGVVDCDIELVWEPLWDQSRLSEEAKVELGLD